MKGSRRPGIVLVAASSIIFIGLFFWLPATSISTETMKNVQSAFGLPAFAIFGIISVLAALTVIALVFSSIELTDPTQALGLPSGSVRAVIALALIVLFAILTVYLFDSIRSGAQVLREPCLTQEERAEMISAIPSGQFHVSRQLDDNAAKACSKLEKPGARFDVTYVKNLDSSGEEFAKQILVLIGTLVTSVASFYFGAQAVSQGQQIASGTGLQPSVTSASPAALKPGESQRISAFGTNLAAISQMQLGSGASAINATNVTSNAGVVQGDVVVPADTPAGPWSLQVKDPQGRSDQLQNAIAIGSAAAPTNSASEKLRKYLQDGSIDATERKRRSIAVSEAATAEGFGDISVAAFIRETSPEGLARIERVTRRLGLLGI